MAKKKPAKKKAKPKSHAKPAAKRTSRQAPPAKKALHPKEIKPVAPVLPPLEKEMAEGAWITVNIDSKSSTRYVLGTDLPKLWTVVLRDMGIDPSQLVVGSGVH